MAVFADRIDDDQSCIEVFDRILNELHARIDVAAIGERRDQPVPVVAVAGENEIGRGKSVQQSSRNVIFFRKAVMRDVAGMDHHVGLRICGIDVPDAGLEISRPGRMIARDVAVGDLNDPRGHRRTDQSTARQPFT